MENFSHPWIHGCKNGLWSLGVLSGAFIVGFSQAPKPRPLTMSSATPVLVPQPPQPTQAHLGASKTSAPPKIPSEPASGPASPTLYRVSWGDTLWSIATKYGVSIDCLMRANHLTSDLIYANTELIIPAVHVVQPGDTLTTLASQFRVTPRAIKQLNPQLHTPLTVGETIAIPCNHPLANKGQLSAAYVSSTPKPTAPPVPTTKSPLSPVDLQLLAHLVQAEAGDQPFEGQVAVAAVVLNRLNAPGFPKTLPEVIEQPGQFQCVTNGTIHQVPSQSAWLAAKSAASGWDPTNGALYYYNPQLTSNHWIRTQPVVTKIGQQIFAR